MSLQEILIKSPRISICGSHEYLATSLYDTDDSSCDEHNNNVSEGRKEEKVLKVNSWKFVRSMKIEPISFCWSIIAASRFLAMQQMIQDKICLQRFNQTVDYCRKLSQSPNTDMKDGILAATSTYTFYYTSAMVIPGLFWCIYAGSWCDKYLGARKLFMFLCSASGLIEAIFLIVNAYFMNLDPIYTVLGLIPAYAIGTHYSGYTAIYSYLAANTDRRIRAVRFATIEITTDIASPMGSLLGGKLLLMNPLFGRGQVFNYIGVYSIGIPASIFVIIWTWAMVHEKKQPEVGRRKKRASTGGSYEGFSDGNNNNNNEQINSSEKSSLVAKQDGKMRRATLKDVISLQDLKMVWTTVTMKRDGNVRLIFWSIFVAHFLSGLPSWGFSYISLPLVERLYFWNSSICQLCRAYARVIGTVLKPLLIMILVPVVTQKLNANDMQLAIIGCVSELCFTGFVATILTPLGFLQSDHL